MMDKNNKRDSENNRITKDQISPCLNCKDRYLLCHSKCERYISSKSLRTELNYAAHNTYDIISDDRIKAIRKSRFKV